MWKEAVDDWGWADEVPSATPGAKPSNENKISDGWPAAAGKLSGAWLRVEGGISWNGASWEAAT